MEESPVKLDDKSDKYQTPTKNKLEIQSDSITPLKELDNLDSLRSQGNSPEQKAQVKTPDKTETAEAKQRTDLVDNDDGMLSTVEQARLLIAACKTPSKNMNRTPVKHNNHNGKRSIESSPVTPGKQRRVELVTISSPKAKRFKLGQGTPLN